MQKKLQKKFIAAAMLSFAAVMVVILVLSMIISHVYFLYESDETLLTIAENGGILPKDEKNEKANAGERDGLLRELPEITSAGRDDNLPDKPSDTAETRYFSVTLDASGKVTSHDTSKIAAVDGDEADEYALAVFESGREKGFAYDYRYLVAEYDGGYIVVFLDCKSSLDTFAYNFVTMGLVMLAALAGVFVLLAIVSGRIVRPVAESYEKQRRFITDAGHEIKTPIAIIEADAEVLELDVGKSEWIDDIHAQTARLAELTNELIFLARMEETDSLKAKAAEFSLSDLVRKTAESFTSRAVTSEKTLTFNVEPDIMYVGDEKSLRELVSVLLDNALKYSDDNGKIELNLSRHGAKGAVLTVYNTAERIDREGITKLFDRFYRADSSRSSSSGGFGIGLSVAKAVTEAHGGKIGAETDDEHSIRFIVTLP
ncbi:MAG: HAMP domain-containing histidine kinase [Firmicutes bacterium]|nr:HAMP domain-containing histidine kinase [Bacillota bacterium]